MAEQQSQPSVTAAERYETLRAEREPYLTRARECAKLTVPHLMTEENTTGNDSLPMPYGSVGAEGTNHLAAKVMLALFPPGGSFFKLDLDSFVLEELAKKATAAGVGVEDARAEFDTAFVRYEKAVSGRMEQRGSRDRLYEAIRQLINSGNVLVRFLDDGAIRLHKMDTYVVKRDKSGNVLEIVVLEKYDRLSLPEDLRAGLPTDAEPSDTNEKTVDVFTRVVRSEDGEKWEVWQEVEGKRVDATYGFTPLNKPLWLPLRWTAIDGEDYGRGYSEEYLGDLRSAEVLQRAIVRFSAAAARVIIFVDENGVTHAADIEEAESGDVVPGNAKDVSVLQLEKYADFQVANTVLEKIEQRLSRRYLLFSSVQRNAERVTAEEIRTVATELEQALGGIYSRLSNELQRPLVTALLFILTKEKSLPALPEGTVEPQILAGLEGLGRNADLYKLQQLIAQMSQLGPEVLMRYLNVGALIKRSAAALGIEIDGLIKSDEQVQQEATAAQQAQTAQAAVGPAINAMAKTATAQPSQE